jgi:hypothetical protein
MHDRLVGEPMEGREIPIWQTVKTAYRLGFESVLAFPSTAIAVTAALFAINTYSIPEAVAGVAVPYWIEIAVYHFVRVVVLAPFAILIHRSIVLGDHAATYWTTVFRSRAIRFIAALLLLDIVEFLPSAAQMLTRYSGWFMLLNIVCLIASTIFAVRVCLAFPAIATDASVEPFRASFMHTRGSAWTIYLMFILAGLIWLPFELAMRFIGSFHVFSENTEFWFAHQAISQAMSTFIFAVFVSAASHLWKTRADWSAADPVAATAPD